MTTFTSCARLAALPLALAAAFPSFAQDTAPLTEVMVTASRFSEPANAVPFGVSVISAEQIRSSGATTVNDAIMNLLGVPGRLDLSGGGNYALDLRGFGGTASRNQVVIVDGLRLKEDDLSATNLAAIPVESVERIEVMRGYGAVQYGEGATGGVIVVTTKAGKGVQRKNSAALGTSFGSFSTREAHASAVLASGGFSVDVSGKDASSNGHRDNFSSTSNNLGATLQWSNDWMRFGVLSGHHEVRSGWPGGLTAAQYASDPSLASSLVNFGSSKSDNTGIFAEATVGDWLFAADVNQRTKSIRNYSGIAYGSDLEASNTNVRARHEVQRNGLSNAFVIGVDSGKWASTSTSGTISDSQSTAVYLTDDLTFMQSGTRLSIGVRGDQIRKQKTSSTVKLDESPTAWQLGLSQSFGAEMTGYGRIGTSYRLATADEFTFTQPNTTLKTQTSRDLELGVRWVKNASKAELRWYRNQLTNELGYDPIIANSNSWNGKGANVNFDPTQRQGIELEVTHQVMNSLDLRGNIALREARFTAGTYAGNDIALVPHQTLGLGANWRFMAGHAIDAGVIWVASQSPTADNLCSMPSYATVDARYAYTVKNMEFALGVKNLSDTKYYTQAFGCTAGVTTSIYPEAGRTFLASVRVKF